MTPKNRVSNPVSFGDTKRKRAELRVFPSGFTSEMNVDLPHEIAQNLGHFEILIQSRNETKTDIIFGENVLMTYLTEQTLNASDSRYDMWLVLRFLSTPLVVMF